MKDDVILKEMFIEATADIPYRNKALFPSELFLFYREALRIEADHIIESGVGNGGSTAYLDRLFPNIQITSIDKGKVEETRALHTRIEFIQGDGLWEVPVAVNFSKAERIAILIDGPKGWQAVSLAQRLLRKDRVKIVAVHDLQSDRDAKIYFDRPMIKERIVNFLSTAYVDSHNEKFRKFAGDLDRNVEAISKYPNGPGLSIYQC